MADEKSEWEQELLPLNDDEKKLERVIWNELGHQFRDDTSRAMLTRYIRGYVREEDPTKETLSRLAATLVRSYHIIVCLFVCLLHIIHIGAHSHSHAHHCFFYLFVAHLQKWRSEVDAAGHIYRQPANEDLFDKTWPTGVHGIGKSGHLIYIDRVGSVTPSGLFENFTMDHVKEFHIKTMEKVNKIKAKLGQVTGRKFYKHIVILDLSGFGMRHMGSQFTDPLKGFIDIDQHHYPESLYKMIIVNAPWAFKMMWAIASVFIHPLTKQRIKMGNKYLKDYIDQDQLPKFLGGPVPFQDYKNVSFKTHDGKDMTFEELLADIENPDAIYNESVLDSPPAGWVPREVDDADADASANANADADKS
jgi:CRAL/TRIO domain